MADSSYSNSFKSFLNQSTLTPQTVPVRSPNEQQYDEAAAFSLIAYKNQDPTQRSDLDTAKLNFESNYYKFLMLFGQYSNHALNQYPLSSPPTALRYPIQKDTEVFDKYPMKRPFR
jgi:hypothetical protein